MKLIDMFFGTLIIIHAMLIIFLCYHLFDSISGNPIDKLSNNFLSMLPRKVPDGEPGGRQYSILQRKWFKTPFYIGQKIVCLSDSDYNRMERGAIYTIRGFTQANNGKGWFINVEEVGISKWWEDFVPLQQMSEHFEDHEVHAPTKYLW